MNKPIAVFAKGIIMIGAPQADAVFIEGDVIWIRQRLFVGYGITLVSRHIKRVSLHLWHLPFTGQGRCINARYHFTRWPQNSAGIHDLLSAWGKDEGTCDDKRQHAGPQFKIIGIKHGIFYAITPKWLPYNCHTTVQMNLSGQVSKPGPTRLYAPAFAQKRNAIEKKINSRHFNWYSYRKKRKNRSVDIGGSPQLCTQA